MPLPQKKLIPCIMLALVIAALAAPPLWWSDGNPPVIDPTAAQNNNGPANIGQAKHMEKSALDALYPVLPDVAAQIEADLIGPGKPIPSWAGPANQAEKDKNHAPLLIGQLKAIADPFYTHLHTAAPNWLEAERIANGTDFPNSIFPWTTATSDDSNKGMANIGQLKAVFSLRFETLASFDSDGDGMPDLWETENGFDPNDAADANADPDGDGINNHQELALGTDPNSFDQIGPVNIGFGEEITDSPDLSFRPENPSDLYPDSSVPHWNAAIGQHIEIWDEGDGNPYAELQSHWDAKGIEQEFDMLPGTRLTFVLRYKGRYDGYSDSNPFKLTVEGAHEVLVNGQPAQTQGSAKQESFMEDDEWEKYADWHYASVSISADPLATALVPITLTLIPENTDEAVTYGGFVDLLPVDITVVFGITPTSMASGGSLSRDLLEDYLETVKVAHLQESALWLVNGTDVNQEDRFYVVEISNTEAKLLESLQTDERKVIFEGHANFGLGPNFSFSTHKTPATFTNFASRGYTDVPKIYRGDGSEADVFVHFLNGPEPDDLEQARALVRMREEGWAYLVLQAGEVMGDALNYDIPVIGGLRFENDQQVGDQEEFEKQGQGFNNEWHFELGGSRRLMVSSPATQVPQNLRYESLFLNTCSSGPHFSENFHHGMLVYTNQTCEIFRATTRYVRGLIEGDHLSMIVADMNADELGGDVDDGVMGDAYELHNFEE